MPQIDPHHLEILTHMLGAGAHVKRSSHGYRNHFCAEIDGDDFKTLVAMQSLGIVSPGRKINDGRDQYFHATRAGCEAAGLSKPAIKRALEG